MKINLTDKILPGYSELFRSILDFEYYRVIVKGGRCSGKSLFTAMTVLIGTMIHRRSAVCCVRYNNKVYQRLTSVLVKALKILGLQQYFRVLKSNKIILLDAYGNDTDVCIYCTGADDPEVIKGFASETEESFWCLWVEEATNFRNLEDINNITSTIGRGNLNGFVSILTYNPRKNSSHWLNKKFDNIVDGVIDREIIEDEHSEKVITAEDVFGLKLKTCILHTCYKKLIKYGHVDWMEASDLVAIQYGEANDTSYYRWYYLGESGGLDELSVFNNIYDWDGDLSKLNIRQINRGLDLSNGGSDPFNYEETYLDKNTGCLYILNEYVDKGGETVIKRVADGIKKINKGFEINTDSAVPLTINQLNKEGLRCRGVKKIPGSVDSGYLWLQSLYRIYICKSRTPVAYKEFKELEYKLDRYGDITNEIPDKNNHSIDAVRYANVNNIMY